MTDEKDHFLKQLDLLLARHRGDVGEIELAELLHSTANGLVALLRPRPAWVPEYGRVEVPYVTPDQFEAALEDLLTRKAICIAVAGVPMMQEVTLRIVAHDRHVDLAARSIQETPAGIVFQIQPGDVDIQRQLVNLVGVLRSVPNDVPTARNDGSRLPELSEDAAPQGQNAETDDEGAAADEVRQPDERTADSSLDAQVADATSSFVIDRRRFETQPVDILEEAEARMTSQNLFEVLGVHFAADTEEVREARQYVVSTFGPRSDWAPELRERIKDVRAQLIGAADKLLVTADRRAHRQEAVDHYKLQTALDMFSRHAETAKMRRDFEGAVMSLRRVVELQPGDEYAQKELAALRRLV